MGEKEACNGGALGLSVGIGSAENMEEEDDEDEEMESRCLYASHRVGAASDPRGKGADSKEYVLDFKSGSVDA